MKVLVDTAIWSLVLRRIHPDAAIWSALTPLIQDEQVAIIGPIRQELLSGVRERAKFERLRDYLRDFSDTEITAIDYEEAASGAMVSRAQVRIF